MVEHHHRSALVMQLQSSDTSDWATVANRPPVPDYDGREDIPDSAIPTWTDKEVYKIVMQAVVGTGTEDSIPSIKITDNRGDSNIGGSPGNLSSSEAVGAYQASEYGWWPDVAGSAPSVDTHTVELESDPILWEQGDLIHLGCRRDAGELQVRAWLFWRHA